MNKETKYRRHECDDQYELFTEERASPLERRLIIAFAAIVALALLALPAFAQTPTVTGILCKSDMDVQIMQERIMAADPHDQLFPVLQEVQERGVSCLYYDGRGEQMGKVSSFTRSDGQLVDIVAYNTMLGILYTWFANKDPVT